MKITKTINGADQWSDIIDIAAGYFSLSIRGTFVGTLTVQRTFDDVNWGDCGTFTGPSEDTGIEGAGAKYRVGAKAGEWTSGSADVLIIL